MDAAATLADLLRRRPADADQASQFANEAQRLIATRPPEALVELSAAETRTSGGEFAVKQQNAIHVLSRLGTAELLEAALGRLPQGSFARAAALRTPGGWAALSEEVCFEEPQERLPIHFAALNPDARVVRLLLQRGGAHLSAEDWKSSRPLHLAAQNANAEVAQAILDAMAPDAVPGQLARPDEWLRLPIHHAARNEAAGAAICSALLAAAGAPQERRKLLLASDGVERIPAHYAAQNGSAEVVPVLLKSCAKDQLHTYDQTSAGVGVYEASYDQGTAEVEHTASRSAEVNGYTPMHLAARNGNPEVARAMLEAGCDGGLEHLWKLPCPFGQMPLHHAAQAHNWRVVQLLAEKKPAAARIRDCLGLLPLHYAVGALNALLCRDPSFVDANDDGQNQAALRLAAVRALVYAFPCSVDRRGHIDSRRPVDIVRAACDDPELEAAVSWDGVHGQFHQAVQDGDAAKVRSLLHASEELVDSPEVFSNPLLLPLHRAARFGHFEVLMLLLAKASQPPEGFDEWLRSGSEECQQWAAAKMQQQARRPAWEKRDEQTGRYGYTAFSLACEFGHVECAIALVEAEVNTDIPSFLGTTGWESARRAAVTNARALELSGRLSDLAIQCMTEGGELAKNPHGAHDPRFPALQEELRRNQDRPTVAKLREDFHLSFDRFTDQFGFGPGPGQSRRSADGRYLHRCWKLVGKGNYGNVYEVSNIFPQLEGPDGAPVERAAIKTAKCDASGELKKETEELATFTHLHIVTLFGFTYGEAPEGGLAWLMVMEFCNSDVEKLLYGDKPDGVMFAVDREKHPPSLMLQYAAQAAAGMRYIHSCGKAHLDLK